MECGSAFIFCGYGSSSSSQCRSGSSCFFNAEPDPALKKLKKLPYGEFFGVEKEKTDCSKVKYHGAGPNLLNTHFYKISTINKFPYIFYVVNFQLFPPYTVADTADRLLVICTTKL